MKFLHFLRSLSTLQLALAVSVLVHAVVLSIRFVDPEAAQKQLAEKGVAVRVVSMPCTEVFDAQDAAWKASVLPAGIPRVAVEAGVTNGWYKYVGLEGAVVGIDTYGESAPAGVLFKHFGLTAGHVAAAVEQVL